MKKIFIETGHDINTTTGKTSGAMFNGLNEAKMVRELALDIYNKLDVEPDISGNVVLDQAEWALEDTLKHFKNQVKVDDIAISFHFNSFEKQSANGSEAFIPNNPSKVEGDLASEILMGLSKLGFTNRGIKVENQSQHTRLGWLRLNGHSILLEVAFISSNKDMLLYRQYYGEIVSLISNTLINFYRK